MYVVHPDWLRPRSKGVLINCEGFTQYIGSSSPLVDVASSLEVLFLPPGVVYLTGGDAQGVPQVAELGDLLKEVTDKSIRPTEEFEGQNKSIKSRMWYLLRKHKMLKMSTREQWGSSLFAEVFSGGKKAEYFERLRWECPLRYEEGLSIFAEHFEKVVCGIWKADVTCEDYRQALSKEIWLSKLRKRKRCLFGFRTSNPVRDLSLEIRRTVPLRFLRKQSC
ncbi:hypothetical protein ACFX10_008474 [Malus domestica]